MEEQKETRISPRNVEDEMTSSYIDYAMSVIVGRALPDVRDGLKPVHRRILYAMHDMGLAHNRAYKKSARVVGEVLGKYHPHGDTAVYDSMVRMVQDFSLRFPLVDGQGNFGSVDGDSPAAMRYTEVRLARIAGEMLSDIEKNTVDFTPNFDGSLTEPVILPAVLPNLLINGSSGIAVGMATNIPPHNITEIVDALVSIIDNPALDIEELCKIVKGPDFPTGGIIYGRKGIKDAYVTGRGSITLRAEIDTEEIGGGREAIIVKELPYQVNKAVLLETIAGLVRDKKITGISNLRDESDRNGMRVVIELKRDENSQIVLNHLFEHTQMQSSFGIIMLALVNNVPKVMNLKELLRHYLEHRRVVVVRRTKFELERADARAHILEGLKIALDNLDRVVKTIRESRDVDTARELLMKNFKLTRIQAQAILDMKLQQLTGLERQKIEDEYLELIKMIEKLKSILENPKKVMDIIKQELSGMKEKYRDERKTQIKARAVEVGIEDLIEEEDVVITISHAGYIKRLPVDTYRAQRRGGKGIVGMTTREEDFIEDLFITSSHSYMLFFTNRGKVHWLKVYEIPEAARTAKGKAVVNLLQLESTHDKITAMIPIRELTPETKGYLLMATRRGVVKKTEVSAYANPRKGGIIAIKLDEGDSLIDVKFTDGKQEVIIGTKKGIAIHFEESDARDIGRSARGVRGINLEQGDEVVGMEVVTSKDTFLVATENGYGKRTAVDKYRLQSRGGKGVINIKTPERNGDVIGIKRVENTDDIILITANGIINRQPVKDIRCIGRATQGVRLIKLVGGDKLVSIARIAKDEEV